jgi:ubiquinone/menaquinone biosynthesis C-methylase UbiE
VYRDNAYQNYWKFKKRDSIENYLIDMQSPHRIWLTNFFNHANSILEVGCDWGGNLILMSKQEKCKFYGIDISPESIELGSKYCLEQGINNIQLKEGSAENLSLFSDASIDIVFSDMLFLYIGPTKIEKVIKEFLRTANKSVYLLEFHSEKIRRKHKNSEDGWIYNYKKVLEPIVGSAALSLIKLPDQIHPVGRWKEFATLIKIEKSKLK